MNVIGPFRFNPVQGTQANSRITSGGGNTNAPASAGAQKPASPVDQLDLSAEAKAAASTGKASGPATVGGDMRLDKIADLRRQIAAGTYDTPEKFDMAFGRMLDSLG